MGWVGGAITTHLWIVKFHLSAQCCTEADYHYMAFTGSWFKFNTNLGTFCLENHMLYINNLEEVIDRDQSLSLIYRD